MNLITPTLNAHWYTETGEAKHDTDLRKARQHGLYPSVTSVLQVKAKPALETWKQQEAIIAALTLPRLPGESEQDFAKRVVIDMKETGSQAAKIGTSIHDFAESITKGQPIPAPTGYEQICTLLRAWITENLREGIAEMTMVSREYGYAGRQDWVGRFADDAYGIVDFKSQNVKPGTKPVFYDEHCYQLAAYAEGKPAKLVNIIISTNAQNPIIAVKEWSDQEKQDGWRIFKHLLAVWQIERNYDPRAFHDA